MNNLAAAFHNLAVALLVDSLWDGGDLEEIEIDVLLDAAKERLSPEPLHDGIWEGQDVWTKRVTQAVHAKMAAS